MGGSLCLGTLLLGGSSHLYRQMRLEKPPSLDRLTPRSDKAITPGFNSAELKPGRSVLAAILPGQNPRKADIALQSSPVRSAPPSATPAATPSISPPAINSPSPQPTPSAPLRVPSGSTPVLPKPAIVKPIPAKPVPANPVPAAKPISPAKPVPAQPASLKPDPNGPLLVSPPQSQLPKPVQTSYQLPYEIRWADPSNYGDRFTVDIYNRPIQNAPIIVLHETVAPANSVIASFQSPHARDADQASYHTMIRRNGTIVYLVPPDKRAYGAGNSIFDGPGGPEAAKTHRKFPPSVNNFAYHISLESPADGYGNGSVHSGYSPEQYQSLAWLVAQSRVPESRITTHKAVDRSGERIDPRSFRGGDFLTLLRQLRGGPS
jgi:hypothetical protein